MDLSIMNTRCPICRESIDSTMNQTYQNGAWWHRSCYDLAISDCIESSQSEERAKGKEIVKGGSK